MAARREGGVWINDAGEPAVIVVGSTGADIDGSAAVGDAVAAQSTWAATQDGTPILAVRKDAAADLASGDGKVAPLQMDASGQLRVSGGALSSSNDSVALGVKTSGGWTPGQYIAAAAANQDSTVIKNGAGQLGYLMVSNINAAVRYLKVYDKATGPTSSDTPKHTFAIPGNTAGAGFVVELGAPGAAFASGISIRLTTGVAANDANAISANETVVNYGYI